MRSRTALGVLVAAGSVALTTALYLLVNAAFLHVLPLADIAASKSVAGDVMGVIFGDRGQVTATTITTTDAMILSTLARS